MQEKLKCPFQKHSMDKTLMCPWAFLLQMWDDCFSLCIINQIHSSKRFVRYHFQLKKEKEFRNIYLKQEHNHIVLTDKSQLMADIFSPCGFGMFSRCWTIFWKSPFNVASRSRATISGVPRRKQLLPAHDKYDKA